MNLKTNYKNISWNGLRKYQMIDNGDGTVSFQDVTQYSNVEDSNILANVLNSANDAINRIMNGEIFYTETEVDALLALKQSLLSFDNVPTTGSNNPVKSGGIKSAIDAVNARIDNLSVFSFHVCTTGEYDTNTGQPTIQNPDNSTFYLVPTGTSPDVFTEWVYINNAWEKFGSAKVDLSNYVTLTDLQDALDDKQDILTFDSEPTENSDNPVTSDGIFIALSGKSDTDHNHDDRYYTRTMMDSLLFGKSDIGHMHDSSYYRETEVDALLLQKRDVSSSYSKTEVDTLLSAKVDNVSVGTIVALDSAVIGNNFSATVMYDEKDLVLYNGRLYRFTEIHYPGVWTGNDAIEVRVDELLGYLERYKSDAYHNHDNRYYTETEVDDYIDGLQDQIDAINSFAIHICSSSEYNPTTFIPTIQNPNETTFYLVPDGSGNDIYNEWIYINNAWEKFGSARIDLSSYYTKTQTDNLLSAKQNALTFDTTPTANSTNPVTSDGVHTALSGKANTSHNHNASNITAGTLPVARGGTGAATATANRIFAGPSSGDAAAPSFRALAAADIPNLNASKITAGTLPVARGGTGANNAEDALTNLGIVDSGWLTLPKPDGATFTGTMTYRKIGKLVYIVIDGIKGFTDNTTIGNIPSGYRPSGNIFYPLVGGYNLYRVQGLIRVYTGGAIQIQFTTDDKPMASTQFYATISYFIV